MLCNDLSGVAFLLLDVRRQAGICWLLRTL